MKRITVFAMFVLLAACASEPPVPEPGFEVIDYDRHSDLQAASGADLSAYSAVLLEKVFRDDQLFEDFTGNRFCRFYALFNGRLILSPEEGAYDKSKAAVGGADISG